MTSVVDDAQMPPFVLLWRVQVARALVAAS